MRTNNRNFDELRPVTIIPDHIDFADGSALIEIGKTRVSATATIEEKVPLFLRGSNTGWITAEYSMLPRATKKRTVRERIRGQLSGRTQEIQRLIGRALRASTDLSVLGEEQLSLIVMYCKLMEGHGQLLSQPAALRWPLHWKK